MGATLLEDWKSYVKVAYHDNLRSDQEAELKQSFFSGIIAYQSKMKHLASLNPENGLEQIVEWHKEAETIAYTRAEELLRVQARRQ